MVGIRIVADGREKAGGVPRILSSMGLRVDFDQLTVGDYILAEGSALERKTVRDFIISVFDGRLFEQCRNLEENFQKPFLLIEGHLKEVPSLCENPKAIYGAMASLVADSKVKLLHTTSKEETAILIELLSKHLRRTGHRSPTIRKPRRRGTMEDEQLYVVASLPGVGVKLGRRLLETFGSPRAVFQARVSELAMVPRLGRAKAAKIYEVLGKMQRGFEPKGAQATLDKDETLSKGQSG